MSAGTGQRQNAIRGREKVPWAHPKCPGPELSLWTWTFCTFWLYQGEKLDIVKRNASSTAQVSRQRPINKKGNGAATHCKIKHEGFMAVFILANDRFRSLSLIHGEPRFRNMREKKNKICGNVLTTPRTFTSLWLRCI